MTHDIFGTYYSSVGDTCQQSCVTKPGSLCIIYAPPSFKVRAGLKPWSFCATIYTMKNERCAALREVLMRARRCGGFVFSLLVSLLFSLEGFVPALILVVLHFILGWSLWWAALAAAVWIAIVALRVAFISWVARCGNTPAPPQENKNPYSVRKTEFGKRSETPGEDADRRDK